MARFEMSSTVFCNQFYLTFLFQALSLVKTTGADWLIEVELNNIRYGKWLLDTSNIPFTWPTHNN